MNLLVTGGLVGGGAARVVAAGVGRETGGGARIPELAPLPVLPLPNGLKWNQIPVWCNKKLIFKIYCPSRAATGS